MTSSIRQRRAEKGVHEGMDCSSQWNNDEDERLPPLRRAGSSLTEFLESDGESQQDFSSRQQPKVSEVHTTQQNRSSIWTDIQHVISLPLRNLSQEFCNNGLPWEGNSCRSLLAGGSGCLYALPALFANASFLERMIWIVQACLSVWADYFHIHHSSIVHGLDRIMATCMLVTTVVRAATKLNEWVLLLGLLPSAFFVAASFAKKNRNLAAWHWSHFGWHLSGGLVSMLVVGLINDCPQVDSSLLVHLCKSEP
jgi:hypothetical protein